MAGDHSFYEGAEYGRSPKYETHGFDFKPSEFGVTTDPRTANQLKAVSDKISTGAKTIEVTGITPGVLETIPEQHLQEIYRLKKLAGIDLTFHGPLIEPTGVTKQGWDESHREQAERQMFSAVQRSHKMDPKGNMVVTFHSSNGLPSPETKEFDEKTGKEIIKDFWVVNERTGQFQNITSKPDYFKDIREITEDKIKETLKNKNEEAWTEELRSINFNAHNGTNAIESSLSSSIKLPEELEKAEPRLKEFLKEKPLNRLYSDYVNGDESAFKVLDKMFSPQQAPVVKELILGKIREIEHGDIYIRRAYSELGELYNQVYDSAKRSGKEEDIKRLDLFREEINPKLKELEKDHSKIDELAKEVNRGVHLLRSVSSKNPPEILKPMKEFAIDKASDTFANLALKSYNEFGDNAPIISIENPPVGMGLTRAEELKDIVKRARDKFVSQAVESGKLSESEAERQAEKLLGVTWDVGHINMLRKYGFGEKQLGKEAKTIAPFVKHVHLSDNFGYEHTELPMGMGNVPTEKHLKAISEYNKSVKKIVETGNWFEPFKTTPLRETFQHFQSPVYAMKMSPQWASVSQSGGYFSGYGLNPDIHHQIYGSGFSGLPVELGGQVAGRSRLSGAPIE